MSRIGDISKKYQTEVENAKKADYDSRYGKHYSDVILPHLKELDDTYNKCVNEMKQKLDEEKAKYIAEQKAMIESEVNAEYNSFNAAIASFLDKD